MKILWVTSQQLHYVSDLLHTKKSGFGGWIMNMAEILKKNDDIEIAFAMSYSGVSETVKHATDGVLCYVAKDPGTKDISEADRDWIINDFNPDIIQIEGTEFPIQEKFSRVKDRKVLVSLQGILNGYEPYQFGQLPMIDMLFSKDFISAIVLKIRKRFAFDDRRSTEEKCIKAAKYLTGRTFWDRAHSYWLNPDAKYFTCNRILRPTFYENEWDYSKCSPHTIFTGNGYSPLKGMHFVLKAVALLKKQYPDVKLFVTGVNPLTTSKKKLVYYGYPRYLKRLIKKLGIEENVSFLGSVDGDKMREALLSTNVYILPSLIENSPNTLGEAMLLGVPCVSAYTGGASEMAKDEDEVLFYRANDPQLAAWQIHRIFESQELCQKLSANARKHASITHDPQLNANKMIEIYKKIAEED